MCFHLMTSSWYINFYTTYNYSENRELPPPNPCCHQRHRSLSLRQPLCHKCRQRSHHDKSRCSVWGQPEKQIIMNASYKQQNVAKKPQKVYGPNKCRANTFLTRAPRAREALLFVWACAKVVSIRVYEFVSNKKENYSKCNNFITVGIG